MIEKQWSELNHLQIGRYAEQLVALELTGAGCQVFSSEVDDRGIDFVVRTERGNHYDLQVKSIRLGATNYIFFPKDKFHLRPNLWAAVVLLEDDRSPQMYLLPSEEWNNPNDLFRSRDYEGKKSKPEWGLEILKRNRQMLEGFAFDKMIDQLL